MKICILFLTGWAVVLARPNLPAGQDKVAMPASAAEAQSWLEKIQSNFDLQKVKNLANYVVKNLDLDPETVANLKAKVSNLVDSENFEDFQTDLDQFKNSYQATVNEVNNLLLKGMEKMNHKVKDRVENAEAKFENMKQKMKLAKENYEQEMDRAVEEFKVRVGKAREMGKEYLNEFEIKVKMALE